jgi:serine/threonine-protein kinase
MTGELVAGRYRMQRRIGAGGMAAVFLAKDCRLERDVAIKRLHADSPEEVGMRFQREAKVGASLNHPNIVGVYDTVTDDEGVLIIMEYVPGHTLRNEISRGRMEPGRVIEVLSAIASALDHAHQAGVVHRDVKPANVLIDHERGIVKLADLGIATAAERTRITHSGAVLGTAAYMAPERLDGGSGGPPVDIYALAAMGFEMLSGEKAVTGSSALEIARRVATQPPADLRETVPDAPEGAAEALKRGLAKDPDERQPSAGELVRQLSAAYAAQAEEQERARRAEAAAAAAAPAPAPKPTPRPAPVAVAPPAREAEFASDHHEPTTAPRMHRASRRPRWLGPAALAAVAVLAIAIVAIVLSSGGSGEPRDTTASSDSAQSDSSSSENGSASSGGGAAEEEQAPESAAPAPATEEDGSAAPAPPTGGESAASTETPDGAVNAFYTAAANDDFDGAWALATPRLQEQVEGYDSFVSGQRSLESIEFPKLEVTEESGDSATVAFSSIARHDTFTDRCNGVIAVVRTGSGWMVDHIDQAACERA